MLSQEITIGLTYRSSRSLENKIMGGERRVNRASARENHVSPRGRQFSRALGRFARFAIPKKIWDCS